MGKNRLEAFSDGVIAIILTIMVLELKVPKEPTIEALSALWPIYVAYTISYGNVFFVWLNHHSIFSTLERVDFHVLWANGFLLFVVSLVPFATAFAIESHWATPLPVILYGFVMTVVSLASARLRVVAARHAQDEQVAAHQRSGVFISLLQAAAFLIGSLCAWFVPRSAMLIFAAVPLAGILYHRGILEDHR